MEIDINTLIRNQIEELDLSDLVRKEIRALISDATKKHINDAVKAGCTKIVEDEIQKLLFAGEIVISNGWDSKERYANFDEFLRSAFRKAAHEKYEVMRTVEKLVKERITSLLNAKYNEVLEKIVDSLTASRLVKKEGA